MNLNSHLPKKIYEMEIHYGWCRKQGEIKIVKLCEEDSLSSFDMWQNNGDIGYLLVKMEYPTSREINLKYQLTWIQQIIK